MKARIPALLGVALAGIVLASCQATGDAADDAGDTMSDVADDIGDGSTWDRIQGNWGQFSGGVKERWGELTDDDVAELDGDKDQLIGRIQETYGIAREKAAEQVDEWADAL